MWEPKKVLTKKTLKERAKRIFSLAKYGESGVAMTFPRSDLDYRLRRFLADTKLIKRLLGRYYNRHIFLTLNVESGINQETLTQKLTTELKKRKIKVKNNSNNFESVSQRAISKGFELFFFANNAEKLFIPAKKNLLQFLTEKVEGTPRINALLFFETDIAQKPYSDILSRRFRQNIFYLPLYKEPDAKRFIRFLEKEWNLKVNQSTKEKIIKNCSGHLWLIKEAIRFVRDNPERNIDDVWQQQSMAVKNEAVFNKCSTLGQQVLEKIYRCNLIFSEQEQQALDHLLKINLIRQENNNFAFNIPLMRQAVKKHLHSQSLTLNSKDQLLLNGDKADRHFSPNEKNALTLLLQKRGKVILREEVAAAIWGEQKEFSDWALDKVMFRLRKRVKSLGLNPKIIQTKKRIGFKLG